MFTFGWFHLIAFFFFCVCKHCLTNGWNCWGLIKNTKENVFVFDERTATRLLYSGRSGHFDFYTGSSLCSPLPPIPHRVRLLFLCFKSAGGINPPWTRGRRDDNSRQQNKGKHPPHARRTLFSAATAPPEAVPSLIKHRVSLLPVIYRRGRVHCLLKTINNPKTAYAILN